MLEIGRLMLFYLSIKYLFNEAGLGLTVTTLEQFCSSVEAEMLQDIVRYNWVQGGKSYKQQRSNTDNST